MSKKKEGNKNDDEDSLLLDQFTVTINARSSPRLEVRLGKERRRNAVAKFWTIRACETPLKDGDEVVALGGPKVSGKIDLSSNSFGLVGERRTELNGESLLDYHRSRYEIEFPCSPIERRR